MTTAERIENYNFTKQIQNHMGLFGDKKPDWYHMSKDDMKKSEKIYSNPDQIKITLSGESFIDIKQFIQRPDLSNDEIIDSTGPCQNGDLLLPSLYILDSKDLAFDRSMAIPGLMLTLCSFTNKFALCIETYGNPFIKYYDATKNKFFPFIIIERKYLKSFSYEDHQKYKAVKPKKSQQFAKNLGAGFWGATGGLIPMLLTKGAFNLVAKAEDDVVEKIGTTFHLHFLQGEKELTIDIACETMYADLCEKFLKTHWTTNTPVQEKEPTTKEERRKRKAEILKVGDKVSVPKWLMHYGHIVKKEHDYAVVKMITKGGSDKFENVDYLKLSKIRE